MIFSAVVGSALARGSTVNMDYQEDKDKFTALEPDMLSV